MNYKMAKNTYLSTIKSKKQTKQTKRTETGSWIQGAFGWLPVGREWGKNVGKGTSIKKYKLVGTDKGML